MTKKINVHIQMQKKKAKKIRLIKLNPNLMNNKPQKEVALLWVLQIKKKILIYLSLNKVLMNHLFQNLNIIYLQIN